jgi:Bax protein
MIKPELPELPIHLQTPFSNITEHKKYSSPEEFEALLASYDYKLEAVRDTRPVPQVFAINIPNHMTSLRVSEKIITFIRSLLPNVVNVKEDIDGVRAEIIILQKKSASGTPLTDADHEWLAALGKDYGMDEHGFDELLRRVDSVPIAMVLAQGIDESGWGTSR